jgi:lipid-A-disaccharide synthase
VSVPARPQGGLRLFITAGEASGDQLGAALIKDIRGDAPDTRFSGVGGPLMLDQGLQPIFPLADIEVMGFVPVLKRLPQLLRRIRQTTAAILAEKPDVVVLIDAQDFSKRVAKQVRVALPELPIIGYVAPSVWAWRPHRARALKPLLDHVMAVFPFEPAVMARLDGPPTSYVGHTQVERVSGLSRPEHQLDTRPTILLLPGSRRSEVSRLLPIFGEAARRIAEARAGAVRFVLPAVERLVEDIRQQVAAWPIKPEIVLGEDAKWQAFLTADAALAASGTVALELGLAGVPMVVGYKVSALEAVIVQRLLRIKTTVLPDIILGTHEIPVFYQEKCHAEALAEALLPLIGETPQRQRQLALFDRLREVMAAGTQDNSRQRAADIILEFARGRRN